MTAAMFKATFIDQRPVKSRNVHQFIFEVDKAMANNALQMLGGLPDPANPVWVAVARLQQESEVMPTDYHQRTVENAPASAQECLGGSEGAGQVVPSPLMAGNPTQPARAPKAFREMSYVQQAGILCSDPKFWRFLTEERCNVETVQYEEDAVRAVRNICLVNSRRDIIPGSVAARAWRELVDRYRVWELVPV